MTIIDLFGVVGLILAIGAALDVCIKRAAKDATLRWLTKAASNNSGFSYSGSAFLDKIFGRRLFSVRSIFAYVAISVSSVAISYWIAVLSTPAEGQAEITVFSGGFGVVDFSLFVLFVAFAALGDIGSYAQTRLFVRAVDQSKNPIVSAGLVVADIVTSLTLFFISFTFARTLAYLIAMQVLPISGPTSTDYYVPSVLKAVVAAEPTLFQFSGSRPSEFTLAQALSGANKEDNVSQLAPLVRKIDESQLQDQRLAKSITYTVKQVCTDSKEDKTAIYTVLAGTERVIKMAEAKPDEGALRRINVEKVDDAVRKAESDELYAKDKCWLPTVLITRNLPFRALIGLTGFSNILWTSAQRTLFDAYTTVGWKLSPYVAFDPYNGLEEYIKNLEAMSGTTILNMFPVNVDKMTIFGWFNDPLPGASHSLHIPFSPMVASSLTSSFFFFGYLIVVWVASVRRLLVHAIKKISPSFDLDVAVFTSMCVAFSVATILLYGSVTIFEYIWSILFE
ncbi:hypothetical protein [Burkholderia gladioli]|uniref:hypothetical protein n=1 Tax=Burkholderia gladioli TaxID=28095 RepID=UPI00163EAB5C|nr:hypothetical protein [Burkholderia gladioli]